MSIINKGRSVALLIGDLISLYVSLWVVLLIRDFGSPTGNDLIDHVLPFSILFVFWILVFFIAGLYDFETSITKKLLPNTLVKAQLSNSILAVMFFYFIPYFGITPKTNLFIYLVVSIATLFIWRIYVSNWFIFSGKQKALIIARGDEMKELCEEIERGNHGLELIQSINLEKAEKIDIQEDIIEPIYSQNIQIVVIDTRDESIVPLLPHFYNLMFSKITFMDMQDLYEVFFGKVPFSLIRHGWFLEHFKTKPHLMYDSLKRVMDLLVSFVLFLISLVVYPVVFIGIKISDRGSVFYYDERVGQDNRKFKIIKFRSMTDEGSSVKDVTKFGKFLRQARIDELPQLINVMKGELSLIGPRPEKPELVAIYSDNVSYYNIRHLIKPGLSGWAQMKQENHPHHAADISATTEKLSYDLFYIKNRSFGLDLRIALQTLKTLMSRKGR